MCERQFFTLLCDVWAFGVEKQFAPAEIQTLNLQETPSILQTVVGLITLIVFTAAEGQFL
jgi:hypothetical protein